ncbi:MAG: hypothetical protein ACFHWX_18400 [Bacteroidota bacterium]
MKTLLFFLTIISISIFISCNKDESEIVEHTVYLGVPGFNINVDVDDIGSSRINIPTDWNHVLGGTGNLVITGITNQDISINIEIDGDQLTTTPITLPTGDYDFVYTVNRISSFGYSNYLPFTASASNITVNTSNQVIDLVGSTDWDLYIVTNQNLCTYSDPNISGEVIWDPGGNGPTSNDIVLGMNDGYYYAYVNSSNNLPVARLLIYYDDSTTDCRMAALNHDTQGGKAYWVTIELSGATGFALNLAGMFTTDEIIISGGADDSGPTPKEEQAAKLAGTWVLESASLGTTPRPEWLDAGFSITLSGTKDGGTVTASNVPDIVGASDVWPSSSPWVFGSSISQVVREADDITVNVFVTDTTLTMAFTITGSGARVDGFDGSWTFSFQKS